MVLFGNSHQQPVGILSQNKKTQRAATPSGSLFHNIHGWTVVEGVLKHAAVFLFLRYQALPQVYSNHSCGHPTGLSVPAGDEADRGRGQISVLCSGE